MKSKIAAILSIPLVLVFLFIIGTLSAGHDEKETQTTEITTETTEPETETETEPITETYIATAYCPCEKCCGKWAYNRPNGIVYGAGGYELVQGVSMASGLPFGTVVRITGAGDYNGDYICHDRPAEYIIERYQGKIIDVYFNSHDQAVKFGKRTVSIQILEETQ